MKVSITDSNMLTKISPDNFAGYLSATGWKNEYQDEMLAIWINGDSEIVLPRHVSSDYAIRVHEAINTLQLFENRSQLDIVTDIESATKDIIRVRLDREICSDGTILINQGIDAVRNTYNLAIAAARAADSNDAKAVYYGNTSSRVQSYIDGLRLGQTERGSYVITIYNDISEYGHDVSNNQDLLYHIPFERQVTLKMIKAVECVQQAAANASRTGDFNQFYDSVKSGVSANLCEAISGLAGDQPSDALEISVSWARLHGFVA